MDQVQEFAAQFQLEREQFTKLASSMTADELYTILELLKTKKHRSGFRAAMARRVREWLANPVASKPLSKAQMDALIPRWPVKYNIPH